jgi:hypothetical protein
LGKNAILQEHSDLTPRLSLTVAAAPARRARSWTTQAFFGETRARILLALVALPLAAATFLLLAPPTVFSREMSWDLLFNLEGAWSLLNGQQLHVDVHDPLGIVTFGLTALGFYVTGPGAKAFLVGETLYAAVILAAALTILPRRLPPAAAAVATIYVVLSILAPTSPGDPIETYSFAMSYNRFGWSTLTLLFVVVFLAPRSENRSWLDQAAVLLLGTLLFYLKITYFGVGIAAIAAALVLSPHVRRQSGAWLGVLTILVVIAAAPANAAYWSDILAALESGAARFDILTQIRNVVTSRDTAIIAVELVCLLWLRRAGVSMNRFVSALFIIGCGAFILSQNEQSDGISLYFVVALLLFDSARMAVEDTRLPAAEGALLLAAVLVPPSIGAVSMGASLVGYAVKAAATDNDVVDDTRLRGLAVPPEQPDLIAQFSASHMTPGLLNAARRQHPQYELTQAEYVQTILKAAETVRTLISASGATRPPHVELLDAVNPLPFMLGLPPSRGRQLWFDRAFPWPPADEFLGRLDYVFVPKFPIDSASAQMALQRYKTFLEQHFYRTETDCWIVFQRQNPARAVGEGSVATTGDLENR